MTMYTESLRAFLKPILPYLDDANVSEIMINGPEDIWIEKKGRVSRVDAKFTEEGLLGAARNMAQFVGRVLNEERPRLDARLPDGSRIHVVLPPIARKGTTISIRKFFKDKLTIDALMKFGSLTQPMARLIDAGIHTKLNMVVSGGTGSGKTTLLNIVSSLIPDDERILTIEDSAELQLNQSHLVPFESRPADKFGKGQVDMGDLLHSALRLRPDRIVVGEVRGGEAFHLMQAMNTGHGGSLATTHANTPTDTLRRLESLCLMSGIELPMVAVRAQVASAINMIICCERLHDGSRKTTALSEVLPLNEKGDYRTQDIFVFTPVTKDEDGHILGYHAPTGIIPNFAARAQAYGFTDLTPEFFDPATYGLPPPPRFAVGEEFVTRWAPSLKHREKGQPDPDEYRDQWQDFTQQLKNEAKAKRTADSSVQVQVPASLPASSTSASAPAPAPHAAEASKPAATPSPSPSSVAGAAATSARPAASSPSSTANAAATSARPAAPASARPSGGRPAPAPAPSHSAHDDDKTPAPTRNPLLSRNVIADEPKVEISDDLLGGVDAALLDSALDDATPARPSLRSSAPAPRRPLRATPAPAPAASEPELDAEEDDGIDSSEKTHIRPMPTPPPRKPGSR